MKGVAIVFLRAASSAPSRRTRIVTASARVGARSRSNWGEPSAVVPVPLKRPRLYSSMASSWASSGVTAKAGTARDRAKVKARIRESSFFGMGSFLSVVRPAKGAETGVRHLF